MARTTAAEGNAAPPEVGGCWGVPGGCQGYSHAAAGGDFPSVAKPGDLGLGEAGDAGRTDDGRLPVGHALLRLAVLEAPHVCGTRGRTMSGAGEGPR